jgi:cbb3-type cytochrome oxidase maturation protein
VAEYLTLGEFVVAALMGLAALSALVWAVASGAFRDVEAIKYQVLQLEGENDDRGGREARSEIRAD